MAKKLRRSMLYIPGNNPAMVQHAGIYGADSILLDLEDAVSITEKDAARELISHALKEIDFYGCEVTIRINPLDTPFGYDDLRAVVPGKPDAIRLPKTNYPDDVKKLDSILTELEREFGIEVGSIKIHPMIETSIGVENAFQIATSSKRVDAITIGGQDLTADMGVAKTEDGQEIFYARTRIVMAAKAAGVDAMDTVYADVDNDEGLYQETLFIKKLGFDGKAAINPRQIPVIHEAYRPLEKDVQWAKKVVTAAEKAKQDGVGVFAVDGKMVDAPVIRRAERVLMMAEIYGM